MPGLNASRSYIFNEEWEFMASEEYRNEVVQFIVKNEDDPRSYFDRVCTQVGFREEGVDQLNEWFEDLTGNPPNSKEEVDIRMLAGEVAPNEDDIIRLIGNINEYDLMELGSWELIRMVLDESKNTFWRMQTPGEYSATALIMWTRQLLMEQIGETEDPLRALINLREMNR
jgi:hypothetical protein